MSWYEFCKIFAKGVIVIGVGSVIGLIILYQTREKRR